MEHMLGVGNHRHPTIPLVSPSVRPRAWSLLRGALPLPLGSLPLQALWSRSHPDWDWGFGRLELSPEPAPTRS